MKYSLIVLFLFLLVSAGSSQNRKYLQDKEAIKEMCGCYHVTFKYAETFRSDSSYSFHEPYQVQAPAEWIFVDNESGNRITIQHLLVVQDSVVIKHWRQDWLYEDTTLFRYEKDNTWKRTHVHDSLMSGRWVQKVYHVDDGPRYEGAGRWIHDNDKHFWEGRADAPLPRREHTKRDDYNVMQRRNRHQLNESGWVHEQDNKKIIRSNGTDSILVQEKGLNIYRRIDDSHCMAAKLWWDEHKAYWRTVRSVWKEIFGKYKRLQFTGPIGEKTRWQQLFNLANKFEDYEDTERIRKEVQNTITSYLKNNQN